RGPLRLRGRRRAAAAARGPLPQARPGRPVDLRRLPERSRPPPPRLHRLLPLVAHGGPRHQPARRDGVRPSRRRDRRWWHPRGRGGRSDGPRGARPRSRGPGRRPRRDADRSRACPVHGRSRTAPLRADVHRGPDGGSDPRRLRRSAVKVRAIVNPRAGVAARAALDAMRAAGAPWGDPDLQLTTAPGDARRMAREAAEAGFDAVVAVGGDGTANEAAWGLLRSPTALGIVPAGSGNGLARTLRIPLRPVAAVRALRDAVVRRMDVG